MISICNLKGYIDKIWKAYKYNKMLVVIKKHKKRVVTLVQSQLSKNFVFCGGIEKCIGNRLRHFLIFGATPFVLTSNKRIAEILKPLFMNKLGIAFR